MDRTITTPDDEDEILRAIEAAQEDDTGEPETDFDNVEVPLFGDAQPRMDAGFDPSQPRDPEGQWSETGAGGESDGADVQWFRQLKNAEIDKLKGDDLDRAIRAAPDRMVSRFLAQWTAEDKTSPRVRAIANAYLAHTTNGRVLEKYHPGNITVYRGTSRVGDETRGLAWSRSERTARGYGKNVYEKDIDRLTPALDLDKMGGGNFDEVITSPKGSRPVRKKKVVKDSIEDAQPRTLSVRRDVVNSDEITQWAKAQGFETVLSDLHVTVAFSRAPVDWMKVESELWSPDDTGNIKIPPGGARLMDKFGDACVLLFNSSQLSWRHEAIKRAGASWDHLEYQPHITITYKGHSDLKSVVPYRGEIVLGPEIFEEVNEDNKSGIKEN